MMGETEGGMMEGGMMRGVVLRGNKEGLGCLNDENDEDNEGEAEEGSMKDELVIELVLAGELIILGGRGGKDIAGGG